MNIEHDELNNLEPMDEFEVKLQHAMRRVDAPAKLAEFLAQATAVDRKRVLPWPQRVKKLAFVMPRQQAWWSGAIAASLIVGAFATEQLHQRHEREQATIATQQFETATRITDRALDHTREQLERAGIHLSD